VFTSDIDLGGGGGRCPGWSFQLLDGYYEKSHGCYKTMMGVNHCLIRKQNVCKRPQSVWSA